MLKQKHGLSMQAWIIRAADLGIIRKSHARALFTEMGRRGWRREEPVKFEADERPKKLRQLTMRALAEGLLTRARAERIWPGVTSDIAEEQPVDPSDRKIAAPSSQARTGSADEAGCKTRGQGVRARRWSLRLRVTLRGRPP